MTTHSNGLWSSRKIIATSGFTLLARIVVPCLNVLLVLAIARWRGPTPLGQYTFLLTLYLLFENLKTLGLNTLVLKQVSKNNLLAAQYHASLWHIGKCGAMFSAVFLLCISLINYGVNPFQTFGALVLCAGLFPSAQVVANETVFLAAGRADLLFKVNIFEGIGRFLISLIFLAFLNGGVVTLVGIYALSRLFAAKLGYYLLASQLGLTFRRHSPRLTKSLIKHSSQFFPIFSLPLLLFRMDIIFLALISGDHEVGIYGAAMRLFTVAMIIPDGILTGCFPPLSHLGAQVNSHNFTNMLNKTTRILGVALISIACIGVFLAPWVIQLLFGRDFSASGPVLSIILCALVPLAFNRIIGDGLVALGEQRRVVRAIVAGTLVSLFAYPLLIYSYGIQGAAWGFLLSALTLLAAACYQAQRSSATIPFSSFAWGLVPIAILVAGVALGNQGNSPLHSLIFLSIVAGWSLFLIQPNLKGLRPKL